MDGMLGTVRVKCLAQEQNAMSMARALTINSWSRVKCTNNEATHSTHAKYKILLIYQLPVTMIETSQEKEGKKNIQTSSYLFISNSQFLTVTNSI